MKLRQPVDDRGQPLPPFARTIEAWRELGAPVELYDVGAAATAELAEHGGILQPDEPGAPGPTAFYARRYWRRYRWRFLQDAGALTTAEQRIVTGWPRP